MEHSTHSAVQGVNYIEQVVHDRLCEVIGKHVNAGDFDEYMYTYHAQHILPVSYNPSPLAYHIRRDTSSAVGVLSIHSTYRPISNTSSSSSSLSLLSPSYSTTAVVVGSPILSFSKIYSIPTSDPISFKLDASISVSISGQMHVHAHLMHSFSPTCSCDHDLTEETSSLPSRRRCRDEPLACTSSTIAARNMPPELLLRTRSKCFSSYLILVGTMESKYTFLPKCGLIVRNGDEIDIPLLLDVLPTPKEFKAAVESMSPAQQAFAKAYRGMQLAGTLTAVSIIQIQPQLEKVLQLPAYSLSKEIIFNNDAMKLMMEYNIAPDLIGLEEKDRARKEGETEAQERERKVSRVKKNYTDVKGIFEKEERAIERARVRKEMKEARRAARREERRRRRREREERRKEEEEQRRIERERLLREQEERILYRSIQINEELEMTRSIMSQNIDRLLDRGERIDSLCDKSDELSAQCLVFQKSSSQLKSRSSFFSSALSAVESTISSAAARNEKGLTLHQQVAADQDRQQLESLVKTSNDLMAIATAVSCELQHQSSMLSNIDESLEPVILPELTGGAGDERDESGENSEGVEENNMVEDGGGGEGKEQTREEDKKLEPSAEVDSSKSEEEDVVSLLLVSQSSTHSLQGQEGKEFEEMIDVTEIPGKLDGQLLELDREGSVRPAILKPGPVWNRERRNLGCGSTTQELDVKEQEKEWEECKKLLDYLTRSGAIAIEHVDVHILFCCEHRFDKSVIDTLVQDNINPIERVDRSIDILVGVVHGAGSN